MIKSGALILFGAIQGYWLPLSVLILLIGFKLLITERTLQVTLSWLVFLVYLLTPLFYMSILMNPVEAVVDSFVTLGLFVFTFILTTGDEDGE